MYSTFIGTFLGFVIFFFIFFLKTFKILSILFAKYFKFYYNFNPQRRGGRVVEGGGLESRCTARYRGFESHPLRHSIFKKSLNFGSFERFIKFIPPLLPPKMNVVQKKCQPKNLLFSCLVFLESFRNFKSRVSFCFLFKNLVAFYCVCLLTFVDFLIRL